MTIEHNLDRATVSDEIVGRILSGEKTTTAAFLKTLERACIIGSQKIGAEHLSVDVYDRLLLACFSGLLAKIPPGTPFLPYLVTCATRAAMHEKFNVHKEHITQSIYVDDPEDDGAWRVVLPEEGGEPSIDEDVRQQERQEAIARIISTADPSLWDRKAEKKRQQYMSGAVDFANRLKDLRKRLDLSQREAAELFGLKLPTYIAYEHACVKSPAPILQKMLTIAEQAYCEAMEKRLQLPSSVVDESLFKEKSMATYAELEAQARALLAQAQELRKQEIRGVVEEIRARIKEYGLTAEDIFGGKSAGRGRKRGEATAKYRGPNGELWSGGPGRRPKWVIEAQQRGEDIEQYRIA